MNAPEFGGMLREWRQSRRLSQLRLAEEAGISARHLCCLENGRARPSREMVQLLGGVLDLPLAIRNALHQAAGFVPPHAAQGATAPALQAALHALLEGHAPHPAFILDGGWNVGLRNAPAERFFAPFRARYSMPKGLAGNAMHVVFHPGGLRPAIINWAEYAVHMLQILQREAALGLPGTRELLAAVMGYPDVPRPWGAAVPAAPIVTMQLALGAKRFALFSTFTAFAMPADAALERLKIESFHPADDATAQALRKS